MKPDISIEYAHIYTNNQIGKEHELSLEILGKLTNDLHAAGKTYSLVVMVDDYSFPDPSFDYDSYVDWLSEQGFKPDLVYRESQLIPVCDEVLKCIQDNKLKASITDYIRAKKYPCSLFVAAWYLLRLGYASHSSFDSQFCTKQLINVLPESFQPFEDQAREIVSATNFATAVEAIHYRFIEGRLIA